MFQHNEQNKTGSTNENPVNPYAKHSPKATLAQRLATATAALTPVTDTPRLDAEILLAHALGIARAKLLASLPETREAPLFDEWIERRLAFEPIAYILEEWEFFSLKFSTPPPLLVPRPETEHLVETALEYIGNKPARILEIGTGTGCIAVAIALNAPKCRIVATDLNPFAIETAAANAARHHCDDRITFRLGDLFDPLTETDAPFDVICSNPPYIEDNDWSELPPVIRLHEAPRALLAGKDGLDVIRRLLTGAPRCLKPAGLLAFEIDPAQSRAVTDLLLDQDYKNIKFRKDLSGSHRIAYARKGASL